jgi:hypothetical protein
MTSAPPELPPLRVIQAALRRATETLARELPLPTATAPDWSQFEWLIARAVAAMHGVSPLLASSLRWSGPDEWRAFLTRQRAHTAERHARIESLLRRVDRGAREARIAAVALKGAELHAMQLYERGERPMGDVDLLVRGADLSRATRLLGSLGFHESGSTRRHRLLLPADAQVPAHGLGEHADNYLKIELHERIAEPLPLNAADITERIFPLHARPGLNRYPSRGLLMLHLLLHAAGSMATRTLRLLQLHDIALLSLRMREADWAEILAPLERTTADWWAWPPLRMAARYYPTAIPTYALNALEAACPRMLRLLMGRRLLSDVSLSSLRIEAFPGIEWSHSASEAARYVLYRLVPDKEMLGLRAQVARIRISATATQWHQLSQGRRMLLWLATRPPRAETLYPVRLALSEAQKHSQEAAG